MSIQLLSQLFTRPSLFKRLMSSVLILSFALWCVVLSLMVYNFKKISAHYAPINLENAAQQQLVVLKAIPNDDQAIRRYAKENEALQKALYSKMSIFVSQNYLQIWRGEQLVYSAVQLPVAKPDQAVLQQLVAVQPVAGGNAWFTWSEYEPNTGLTVRIAQEPSIGMRLSYRSTGYYLMPFVISVPFLFFPVWWAISRGLRPLNRVAEDVIARNDTDLSRINNTSYRELSPIVNAINRLMEQVGTRIQREQEFLHDAAHELKTPLAVIQLNSEILADAADPAIQKMAIEGIQKGVSRATHTTHQLLASARAENHQQYAETITVNFTQLLQDRLAQWMSLALQKNIEIELDAPDICELNVDLESITLLVDNLIDNAIKYSAYSGAIHVRLIQTPLANVPIIRLQVCDEGCGIPAEYRGKVFERFFRINPSDSHGTGLGLSIVKRAAEQHSATIELTDNVAVGHGLIVTITFQQQNQNK